MEALDFKNWAESNISPQEINQDINSSDENDSSLVYDERIFNADIHNDIMDIVNNGNEYILNSYQHEGYFDDFVEEMAVELSNLAEEMEKGETNDALERFYYKYDKGIIDPHRDIISAKVKVLVRETKMENLGWRVIG